MKGLYEPAAMSATEETRIATRAARRESSRVVPTPAPPTVRASSHLRNLGKTGADTTTPRAAAMRTDLSTNMRAPGTAEVGWARPAMARRMDSAEDSVSARKKTH